MGGVERVCLEQSLSALVLPPSFSNDNRRGTAAMTDEVLLPPVTENEMKGHWLGCVLHPSASLRPPDPYSGMLTTASLPEDVPATAPPHSPMI